MDSVTTEEIFGKDVELTDASREEISEALSLLEEELGLDWIKATKASIGSSWALGRMVTFAKCIKVADTLTGGNTLKRKLCSSYLSEECQDAIAEALTAERILTSGATVEYEPQLPGTAKRPDLFANWGPSQHVAFEVVFPSLSAQEAAENRKMGIVVSQCAELLTSGALNIYLTESRIDQDTANSIVAAIGQVAKDVTRSYEMHMSDRAYVAYDPDFHQMQIPAPDDLAEEQQYVSLFPVTDPAYHKVKEKLGILTPMHSELHLSHISYEGRIASPKLIVRMHRPVMDQRAFGKAEQEHEQLPSGSPGVVVIDMSRTSLSLMPVEWAKYIHDSFVPNQYQKMSAVWLRSGAPVAGAKWAEWLIGNPYAATKLPPDIATKLFPGAVSIDLH